MIGRSLALALGIVGTAPMAAAQSASTTDPRVGLAGGHYVEASSAISNLELVAHKDRPQGFFNPGNPGDFGVINSDLAFSGNSWASSSLVPIRAAWATT